MANDNEWCFAWEPDPPITETVTRGAMPQGTKWRVREITVSFLDDDHGLREKVRRYAREWTNEVVPGMANLRLLFRTDTNDTNIRISFRRRGNSSVVGTTCLRMRDLSEPTMHFGNLNAASSDQAVRRAVLHEFGHALGLVHEHQNPDGGIRWNEPAILRDLMRPPHRWTQEQIRKNLFERYDRTTTNFTAFDPESIMIYPIPASWTTDSFSVDWNTDLSDEDRRFIAAQYP